MPAEHGVLAHHFENLEQQRDAEIVGMWIFLATEVLIFGALFTGYTVYRCYYPNDWEAGSSKLNILIGAINTVVLLTSSLTMALSVHAARLGRYQTLLLCLILTALLGAAFMGFKAVEYYTDYYDGLVPSTQPFQDKIGQWAEHNPPAHPDRVRLFLMFYYIMTGLHALHLTIGIGWLAVLAVLAGRRYFTPERYMPIEIAGLYWHFIDIVWIFLLPLLYLTGQHELRELLHF